MPHRKSPIKGDEAVVAEEEVSCDRGQRSKAAGQAGQRCVARNVQLAPNAAQYLRMHAEFPFNTQGS